MIYIDSSVVLAQLLDEERAPPEWLWDEELVASRLLEYEVWNRAHAYDQAIRLAEDITMTLRLVLLMEMEPPVLSRALEPIPRLSAHPRRVAPRDGMVRPRRPPGHELRQLRPPPRGVRRGARHPCRPAGLNAA